MSEIPEQALFIHDVGGGAWEWCVWHEVFKQFDIECHSISIESLSTDISAPIIDYKNQLVSYAQQYELDNPIVVGAGMGAMLGLQALNEIDASALILINPLGPESITSFVEDPHFSAIRLEKEQGTGTDPNSTQTAQKSQTAQSEGNALPTPQCPCLVLIGEGDDTQAPETGNELAEKLSAEVMSFGGTSHIGALLGFEAKAIARQVCQWLVLRDT